MTKVLGLAGSPRRGGNTETLLDTFLSGAAAAGAEVEKLAVSDLQVAAEIDPGSCWEDGHCTGEDDYRELCEKMVAADVIVVSAPLYFANVPAQLKLIVDRSQCQWVRKVVDRVKLPPTKTGHRRRRGVFLCVGGQREQNFGCAAETINSMFRVYEADLWAQLLHGKVDAMGEVETFPGTLRRAFELGQSAVTEAWEE
jgi:multimeric flavodoxin WrbA